MEAINEALLTASAAARMAAELSKYGKLKQINFWRRLEMFVENVNVNDPMSEEEKEMIIRIAKEYQSASQKS